MKRLHKGTNALGKHCPWPCTFPGYALNQVTSCYALNEVTSWCIQLLKDLEQKLF
jgi:hypothetical protein